MPSPFEPQGGDAGKDPTDLSAYRELRRLFGLSATEARQIDIEIAREWGLLSRPPSDERPAVAGATGAIIGWPPGQAEPPSVTSP